MIPSLAVPINNKDILNNFKNNIFKEHTISEFENTFSQYIGCKYAIATGSGTAALFALLNAYGLKKGDEILMPAYTCETLGRLLIDMRLAVKFVDVDTKTYTISLEDLKNKISKNTKAIIAVHMFGNPCEMDGILDISNDKGAIVIEDAAQAMGAEYENRKVGTIGDSGFFSLGEGKPITTMGGGILVTGDSAIANKSKKIIGNKNSTNSLILSIHLKSVIYRLMQNRSIYSISYNMIESRRLKRRSCLKECPAMSFIPSKYTDMQASMGISQLSHLELFNNARITNAEFLIKNLINISNLKTLELSKKCKSIYLRLPIRIENITFNQREELIKKLQSAGIDASVAYPNSLPKFFELNTTRFANTEELVETTITLPTHPLVKGGDLLRMIYVIKKFCMDLNRKGSQK